MKIARSISHNLLTLFITLGSLSACAYQNHEASELASNNAKPSTSLVLVHGANLRASSFVEVERLLTGKGLNVTSPQIYTPEEETDLATVAGRLCKHLEKIEGPSILVGHSQGGAIIAEATTHCSEQISSLIFIAAVIPLPGEGVFDKLSTEDIKNFEKCAELRDESYFVPVSPRGCHFAFMNNVISNTEAHRYFERDFAKEHIGLGSSKANYDSDKLNRIPKSYIKTLNDKILSPSTQNRYLQSHDFTEIISINSDHTPFYSQPEKLSLAIKSLIDSRKD